MRRLSEFIKGKELPIDTWRKSKNFIEELDSDPNLLADFNLQMRRRKLDKIKQSKKK